METNLITRQETLSQLLANGQRSPKVLGRKRSMQREAYRARTSPVPELLLEQFGKKHKMVIMHPDHVTVGRRVGNSFSKEIIDLFIRSPCFLVKRDGLVVQNWPEDLVYNKSKLNQYNASKQGGFRANKKNLTRKPIIMLIRQCLIQKHGNSIMLSQTLLHFLPILVPSNMKTRPTEPPETRRGFAQPRQ